MVDESLVLKSVITNVESKSLLLGTVSERSNDLS